jgi:hypothetical protein
VTPRLAFTVRLLRRMSASRKFLPILGLVAAADYALWFLPSKSLVIVAALLHPHAWLRITAWFTAGSVVGATAFAAAVGWFGPPLLSYLFGDLAGSGTWQRAHALMVEWGALALFVMAALPWPLRTAVAVCTVLGLPLAVIAASIAAGRFLGFAGLTYTCGRAPHLLTRYRSVNAALGEAGEGR